VTFLQAGTGATQRTALAKLRDTVSVKDFGAVGDGIANDTVAIQAALSSGATSVHITAGTYLVTGLTVAASCTIYGNGVLKKGTASATPLLNITASNVTVDGVEFRGASYNATPTTRVAGDTAIRCVATSSVSPYANLAIRNVIINGFADFGVNVQYGQDTDVSNIAVAYCGYAGILFLSVLRGHIGHNNIREINSSAGATNWYGISLTRDPSQTSVASIPCTQCIIANNIVTNITQWTGIDTHAAYRCIITGNNVSGCTRGIYAQYDDNTATYPMAAQQVEISNNTVVGPATASASVLGIASLGLAALPNDGIFIIGNVVIGCGDYASSIGAIHIASSTNSKASDNHVMRAIRMGISLTGTSSYVDISRNIVDGVQAGASSASYAYLQLANLTNCSFNDNRMRNTTGSGTFTPAQGIIYDGTTPSTGVVLSSNRMDSITNKLLKISGSANIYTDLAWKLETESCAAFTHSCTGGAVIEATASQVSNFRRTPNTTGTSIVRPRVVFEPAVAAAYRLGVRGNYGGGTIYGAGIYSLDGTTNITAATSVPNIVISIDGIYWND
jgi:parallel beta-helix repeat protein